ncbi:MAG: hypothetical protein HYX65_05675 [Gemmatimonadetes bacterium]|nr:hypothetical protein [Gemmatimonadota bacterium]
MTRPCFKRGFATEAAALRALARWRDPSRKSGRRRRRFKRDEQRAYECLNCRLWHLTKQPKVQLTTLNAALDALQENP